MTNALSRMQAAIAQAASTAGDMSEAVKGGAGSRVLPEGYAFARLVEYVEFGNQPQEFGGVAKAPALEVQLGFALTGQGYQNEDGSPYIIRPWPFAVSRNDKSKAFLLFKSLNWKGGKTHFAELLGETFLAKVFTTPAKDGKPGRSALDFKGFLPPLDPVTKAPYPIAEAPDDMYRLFLWDYPTLEDWNKLEITGTFDDGKSKNYTQNAILSALNFAGSALEALLHGAGKPTTAPGALPAAPGLPAVPTAPAMPAVPAAPSFPPAVPAPVAVAPALPTIPVTAPTTSPSSPAMPVMPALPSLPSF